MKLGRADVVIQITELGTYTVNVLAEDTYANPGGFKSRRMRFELPVGQRPILQDLASILRMAAEELSR